MNDAAGHAAGDALLCKVAEVCCAAVRASDVVARLGGDEFAIILNNCAPERAHQIAERLVHALNPLELEWEGSSYTIGASMGLVMSGAQISQESEWLKAADAACSAAKREGRGRLWTATMTEEGELHFSEG